MREILFRGKTQQHSRWIYGDLNHYMCDDGVFIAENGHSMHRVFKESTGQFTGLRDKNNTKIFEGDIVTCQTKYGADVGQIIFAMGKFCVWWHSEYHYPNCAKMIMCYDINSKTKVIGNMIDNPELINN